MYIYVVLVMCVCVRACVRACVRVRNPSMFQTKTTKGTLENKGRNDESQQINK